MLRNSLKFSLVDKEKLKDSREKILKEIESGEIGYFHLSKIAKDTILQTREFVQKHKFKNLVVVGMGGSSLGVKAVVGLLEENYPNSPKIYFLDNLDSYSCKKVLDNIVFKDTLFIISSKTGTTIETISIFKYIVAKFSVLNLSENFIFITDKDSSLEKFGKECGVEIFHIPQNVGGRFSVFSAVGLVPFEMMGFDTLALIKGEEACKSDFLKDDFILQKAYHYATHRNAKINVVFSYLDKFESFNQWYVQLWAESLGKKKIYERVGLTPVGLIGSRDQHSFLQLIMDGIKDKTVTFLSVKASKNSEKIPNLKFAYMGSCDFVNGMGIDEVLNYQAQATMQAVVNEGVSVDSLEFDTLDEWHVGYLLSYYELLTSAVGAILGINTYDQPGVEIGKRILKNIILKG
ncbi:glucose-6-phosphate isomerase [Campylobacter geochelonis]|uniref:glucose-6-phosphate isomerase n=1 Tax=Campylobacter geochelonis TaxID=1780362 RepID=UPI00077095A0|nr:glucose-6-phosphate isomerase [Campylobacter geochelonis]CZE51138.1 glucose-6-phosphate isomerase [Campylobacter geochelonis]